MSLLLSRSINRFVTSSLCVYTHNHHLSQRLYDPALIFLKTGDSMKLVDLTHLVSRDFKQVANTSASQPSTPQPVKNGGSCCSSCSGK
jgi:hypothetical protein